jgi:hypothetical protein
MIPSFLRGFDNPPPENWFTKVEPGTNMCVRIGVVITVAAGGAER